MKTFIFPLKIYIEDTDCLGVVYHSNYLKFFERARSEWAEQVGAGIVWQREQRIYLLVRSAKLDFLRPARLNDQIEVISQIINQKPASFVHDQYLRLASAPDTILCRAEIKIACVDQYFRPQALPQYLSDIIMGESA
jgi:acyl-CoA thioester hydrolase